jgi:hypothetical protein
MLRNYLKFCFAVLIALSIFSCTKNSSDETVIISVPLTVVGQSINDTILPQKDAAGNAIPLKGTMKSGKRYHIYSDVTINAGDTLYLQPGTSVIVHGDGKSAATSPAFYVNGTLVSDGSKDKPNWFTVFESATTPKSNASYTDDSANDPAFKGYWGGIQCSPSAKLLILRWTHIEYTGGPWGINAPDFGAKAGDPRNAVFMSSASGAPMATMIIEDSWFYGSTDDCIGKCQNIFVSIMRNTLTKTGGIGGEGINLKDGCIGDMAYNFCFGGATNGLKTSGDIGKSAYVNIYNNTVVNCGFRQTKATRNGSINTETNAGGFLYNNIIANCKQGIRITYGSEKGKPADTMNTSYNNNLTFIGRGKPMGGGVEQYMVFIEPLQFTKKQSNDFNGYVNGATLANGTNAGSNTAADSLKYDPLFVNFNLASNSIGRNYRINQIPAGANFSLQAGSPAIGAGVYPGGTGKNAMPTKPSAPKLVQYGLPMSNIKKGGIYGANITPPNKDLGAFPTDKTGNQHTY